MCQICVRITSMFFVDLYPIFVVDTVSWIYLGLCNKLPSYTFLGPLQCKYTRSTASYTVKWANTKSILSANDFSDHVLKCTLSTNAPFKNIVCHFSKRVLKWSNFPHNFIQSLPLNIRFEDYLEIIRWKCYKLENHYSNTSFETRMIVGSNMKWSIITIHFDKTTSCIKLQINEQKYF